MPATATVNADLSDMRGVPGQPPPLRLLEVRGGWRCVLVALTYAESCGVQRRRPTRGRQAWPRPDEGGLSFGQNCRQCLAEIAMNLRCALPCPLRPIAALGGAGQVTGYDADVGVSGRGCVGHGVPALPGVRTA